MGPRDTFKTISRQRCVLLRVIPLILFTQITLSACSSDSTLADLLSLSQSEKGAAGGKGEQGEKSAAAEKSDKGEKGAAGKKGNKVEKEGAAKCDYLRPNIHQIGDDSILTFQKSGDGYSGPPRDLYIPIEGRDFRKGCVGVGVYIIGTEPVQKGDFQIKFPSDDVDVFGITLSPSYLERVQSGDQITIKILVSDKVTNQSSPLETSLRYVVRKFTLYETSYYRSKVLASQVPLHQIKAFPLPEQEARALFGPAISNSFFAVRLTIRNTDNFDKLINSGMIVAHGRALIEPLSETLKEEDRTNKTEEDRSVRNQRFSVSLSVTPQSDKQMFTMLDDGQPFTKRNWIFRSLDFIGALATVASPGSKVVSVFTGVFNPSAKELFPDRYVAFKRNMVAYAMPELIKISRRDSVGHRYLFFSKNTIEGLITDQSLFGKFQGGSILGSETFSEPLTMRAIVPKPPKAALISLQFDHLEIPFERVEGNLERSVQDRLTLLDINLKKKRGELERISTKWKFEDKDKDGNPDDGVLATSKEFLSGMTYADFFATEDVFEKAKEKLDALVQDATRNQERDAYLKAQNDLKALQKKKDAKKEALEAAKTAVKNSVEKGRPAVAIFQIHDAVSFLNDTLAALRMNRVEEDLLDNRIFGLDTIRALQAETQNLTTAMISGRDPDVMDDRVKFIENAVGKLEQSLRFYVESSSFLKDADLVKVPSTSNYIGEIKVENLKTEKLENMAANLLAVRRQLLERGSGLPLMIGEIDLATTKFE